ncbi:MAG: SprT family zinc-dependent metalloprotease [Novosphingobium sp.]|uniref:M48 family metallopeptidase n=1 Tax=Novosphingobium sp. TaxID=1874826 RepID=UPI003C7EC303
MIEWLLRKDTADPTVEVAGRLLPLVIRRNAQARRMTMRLAPDGSEVRVTLPSWGRSAEALAFARQRAGWLAGQLAAVPQRVELGHGTQLSFLGEQLEIRHDPSLPRKVSLGEGAVLVGGPAASLQSRLKRWLEGEARRLIAEDLSYYCLRAGQPQQALMLTNAKRRWGSCARDGTIRINWRLVMAPSYVRRSVVAHEVAHLVHFDHSPAFHAFLDEIFEGEIAAANRWLKRDGKSLYLPMG